MNAIERIDTLIERNTHQLNLMGFCLDGESSQEEINKMKYGMGFLVIANKDLEWVKESVTETTCSDVEKSLRGLLRHVDRLIKSLELRETISTINDPAAIREDFSSLKFWTNQAFMNIKNSLESTLETMNNKEQ